MKTLWRNEEFSNKVRTAKEVIMFEVFELGNVDIPDTVYQNYIVPNKKHLQSCGFSEAINRIELFANEENALCLNKDQDLLDKEPEQCEQFANDILSIVKAITGINVKYVLWLADKQAVKQFYGGNDENILEYETSHIILSNLGWQGYLFGYTDMPRPVEKQPYSNSN